MTRITLDLILTEFLQTEKTFLNVISVIHFIFSLIHDYLNNNKNKKSINEIELLLQNSVCKEIIYLTDNNSSSNNKKLLKSFYKSLKKLNENEKKQLKQFLKIYLFCTKQIIAQQSQKLKLFQQLYNENSELIKNNYYLVSFQIVKHVMNDYILQFNLFEEYFILLSFFNETFNSILNKTENISKLFSSHDVSLQACIIYYASRIPRYRLLFNDMVKYLSKLNGFNDSDSQVFNEMFDYLQNKLIYFNKLVQGDLLCGIKKSYKLLFEMKRNNRSLTEIKTLATCYDTHFLKTENLIVKESTNGFLIVLNNFLMLNENTFQLFNTSFTFYNGEFEILDNEEVFRVASNEYKLKYLVHYTLFNEMNKQFKIDLELCKDKKGIVLKVGEEKSFTMKFNSENKCCKVWNIIIQQRELEWNKNYKQKKLFNVVPLYLNDISLSFN
ncbi:hypothetical protein ABK040_004277 [Willaertia magna]